MDKITERDKYLAGHVGDEWHELDPDGLKKNNYGHIQCVCGERFHSKNHGLAEHYEKNNPTYHTAVGRQRLLEFLFLPENKELCAGFLHSNPDYGYNDEQDIVVGVKLLIPEDALAIAVYDYLKGRQKGQVIDTHA